MSTVASFLAEALARHAEAVCQARLSAGARKGNYWIAGDVYGAAGHSLYVRLAGEKVGQWHDAATGESGDLLDLLQMQCGLSVVGAFDEARQFLGLPAWEPGDEHNRTLRKVHEWDRMHVDGQADHRRPRSEEDLLRIGRAQAIWAEAGDPRDTLAERYLRIRHLDGWIDLCGRVLRYLDRCPWRNENTGKTDRVPALVVPFRSIDDDEITGIHRIALRLDGSKIDRRMLGVVHRAAVKLDPLCGTLAVGEGVETAMAARQLGISSAWALGSVGAISFLPVIDGVERLIILGEAGKASNDAIRICGSRWRRAGRRVTVARSTVGKDMNDALKMEASA